MLSTISPVTIFFRDLKDLMVDKSFLLLMISYGLNGGCYYALSPLLSQIIKPSLMKLDYTSAELDVKIGTMAILGFKKIENNLDANYRYTSLHNFQHFKTKL